MRSCGVILLSLILSTAAFAQAAPKPKAKASAPKTNPVSESYKALSDAERIGIQRDLIWSGDYNGTVAAEFGERAIEAVRTFQKVRGHKETGVLNLPERATLGAVSRKKQNAVGWQVVNDPATGVRIGIPGKLVPQAGRRTRARAGRPHTARCRSRRSRPRRARLCRPPMSANRRDQAAAR